MQRLAAWKGSGSFAPIARDAFDNRYRYLNVVRCADLTRQPYAESVNMPMGKSARTIFAFSFYLLILGIGLIFIPNQLLRWFGLPPTHEIWIRLLGMLVFVLGGYYGLAAKSGYKPFFRWTVYGRMAGCGAYLVLIILGMAPIVFVVPAVADALSAMWTHLSLKSEKPQTSL